MRDKYLVVNGGSSSLKFSLYELPNNEIMNGYIQKIGLEDSFYTLKINGKKIEKKANILNHIDAVNIMFDELISNNYINDIRGVGHRVLHGGEIYSDSVIIDDETLNNIKSLEKFGPLHLPSEIAIIEVIKKRYPDLLQVATFDTAFHQTIESDRYIYPIPYEYYTKYGVRKYGFHGTSHKYIRDVMVSKLNNKEPNLIICHIGSGASISAIKDGVCVNTSMGLTPLDGLMMGTRSGSIDPSIIEFLVTETNMDVKTVTSILNKKSGMLGLTGKSDLRDVNSLIVQGDELSILAMKIYINSIVNYIAQYYFQLNGNVDAIVFTAGVGENDSYVREQVVNSISNVIGSKIDKKINDNIAAFKENQSGVITTDDSKVPVYVIPTDEEYMILNDTVRLSNERDKSKSLKLSLIDRR